MIIREDLDQFLNTLPKDVTLVAATKYLDAPEMRKLYSHGVANFGENRVDAFLEKYEALDDLDISWHFIGHLQTNKAKKVINKINYLHSLDSLKLADIIQKERTSPLDVFVEVSINEEESKNGVKVNDIDNFISEILKNDKINLVGLMMMSIKYSDEKSLHEQFSKLRILRDKLEQKFSIKIPYLSMGMSDDYLAAIKEKSTHIRLGRILYK